MSFKPNSVMNDSPTLNFSGPSSTSRSPTSSDSDYDPKESSKASSYKHKSKKTNKKNAHIKQKNTSNVTLENALQKKEKSLSKTNMKASQKRKESPDVNFEKPVSSKVNQLIEDIVHAKPTIDVVKQEIEDSDGTPQIKKKRGRLTGVEAERGDESTTNGEEMAKVILILNKKHSSANDKHSSANKKHSSANKKLSSANKKLSSEVEYYRTKYLELCIKSKEIPKIYEE